jgi:hypothetical protein
MLWLHDDNYTVTYIPMTTVHVSVSQGIVSVIHARAFVVLLDSFAFTLIATLEQLGGKGGRYHENTV